METKALKLEDMTHGDLFTIHAPENVTGVARIARGHIFRLREIVYPYVYADHNPIGSRRWVDSPWRIDLSEGIELLGLTTKALFNPSRKKKKKVAQTFYKVQL